MPKTLISIRIDQETLDWFKAHNPHGYQTKINHLLNHYRREEEKKLNHLIGRAQQIFLQYHSRCFWHLDPTLKISSKHIPLIQLGLRKYGGREGYFLAAELELFQKDKE